jgi:catechol 2,3-dioxygenase-like lactoylglutathione lyase family enzyme
MARVRLTGAGRGRHSSGMSDVEGLPTVPAAPTGLPGRLELGAFSVSLSVADLDSSREFYEKLGFEVTGGAVEHDYLILKNGETTIGLFHGMFEGNILTFNPGLTPRMERLESYADVRTIQAALDDEGVAVQARAEGEAGPASIALSDPDGNAVLIDQFF